MKQVSAREAFELTIDKPSLPRRLLRRVAFVVSNVLGEGSGMPAIGGRTATVTERVTGRRVARATESSYETVHEDFSQLIADHDECSADEFRERWATPPSIITDA